MPASLSCFILTRNCEQHLDAVLASLHGVADEIVVVDSGSTDATERIARRHGVRWLVRPFTNFPDQRRFAQEHCTGEWVMFVDGDEVLEPALGEQLRELKSAGFRMDGRAPDAFRLLRRWFVLGQEVHAFYPISAPDRPLSLYRRSSVGFRDTGRLVHETPEGFETSSVLFQIRISTFPIGSIVVVGMAGRM
ncbi:MAG: glycosyltransferase family 2 protein [Gemmatimonadaceae bacterium]